MSLRITPLPSHQTSTSNNNNNTTSRPKGAPSAPGIPDTLRASLDRTAATTSISNSTTAAGTTTATSTTSTSSTHPLESRLKSWTATQDGLKHEILRRTYGVAEPVRRGMELKLVREGDWRPTALGGGGAGGAVASVHEDVLNGRDCEVSWEDVWTDGGKVVGGGVEGGVHEELEERIGMWKW